MLIGPQSGNLRESVRSVSHDLGNSDGLILRILPSFEPYRSSQKRIEMLGHVPCSEDAPLCSNHRYVAGKSCRPQGAGGTATGMSRSDDDDMFGRHVLSPRPRGISKPAKAQGLSPQRADGFLD
jgi:hypothetical protein